MSSEAKQGRSPYQRYGKTPFRYSEAYNAWRRAVGTSDEHQARRAHDAFLRRQMPFPTDQRDIELKAA